MKMVKKILLGTLAVAAILSIASCKREEGGNSSIIDVKAASSSASIDKTNDGDSVTRGFKTLQTKHLDAICHIETTVTDLVDKTVNGQKIQSAGTMGYILLKVFIPSHYMPWKKLKENQAYIDLFKRYLMRSLGWGIFTAAATYLFALNFDHYFTWWYISFLWILLLLVEFDKRFML